LNDLGPAEAVIFAVAHKEFRDGGWATIEKALGGDSGIVLDLKAALDRDAKPGGITLWRP
jgi:UDP-N-acetyl-D-galactosamine dehydrogenase